MGGGGRLNTDSAKQSLTGFMVLQHYVCSCIWDRLYGQLPDLPEFTSLLSIQTLINKSPGRALPYDSKLKSQTTRQQTKLAFKTNGSCAAPQLKEGVLFPRVIRSINSETHSVFDLCNNFIQQNLNIKSSNYHHLSVTFDWTYSLSSPI